VGDPVRPEQFLHQDERVRVRIIDLSLDTVRLTDGQTATRELLRHPGRVAVVTEDACGRVILAGQVRYAAGAMLGELPAGTREPGVTAQRELAEAASRGANTWERLGAMFLDPGARTELRDLLRATGRGAGNHAHPDPDEPLKPRMVTGTALTDLLAPGGCATPARWRGRPSPAAPISSPGSGSRRPTGADSGTPL